MSCGQSRRVVVGQGSDATSIRGVVVTFNAVELARSLGDEEGPTPQQVAAGTHGNGVWDALTPERMQEVLAKRREHGRQQRQRRIEAFDTRMVSKLEAAAELQGRLIDQANRVLKECEEDNRVPTKDEMDLIKRGQAASEIAANRTIGKAAQRIEHSGQVDLVSIIAGEADLIEEAEEAEWEDVDEEGDDEDSWSSE